MKRCKPIEKPRPQIGDFVARDVRGWCIWQVTGPGYWDLEFFGCACATQEGAEKLAALMNAARELAERSHILRTDAPYRGADPKHWAMWCIVSAVGRAIDGPKPEMFNEFVERRDFERCEKCQPEAVELANAPA
jgi:hypothetical protein